jgi:uncharacterized protein
VTQSIDAPRKPVPQPDDLSRPFFEGARRGELMIQRCADCRAHLAPGSRACTECLGERLDWVRASGLATLFTFAVMHQRYHPAFADDLPYNIAVVELAEGPRLNTTITGIANDGLQVGMPLIVTFEDVGEGVTLPKFRPVE